MKLFERRETMTPHLKTLLIILVAPIFVLWAWNAFMPEMLGLAEIRYKHALALLILAAIAGSLLRPRSRRHRRAHNDSEEV